jgi:hypothetical protein
MGFAMGNLVPSGKYRRPQLSTNNAAINGLACTGGTGRAIAKNFTGGNYGCKSGGAHRLSKRPD